MAITTGMRRSELTSLEWRNIGLSNGLIRLRRTKSGKGRDIPVNAAVREVLGLLEGREGRVLDVTNFENEFPQVVRVARLEDFRFHDLRHAFASHLVFKGVDLYTIKELLGHSTIEMTQQYAHLSPNQKRVAVEMLGLGAN